MSCAVLSGGVGSPCGVQADATLSLPLRRLTSMEQDALKAEAAQLEAM